MRRAPAAGPDALKSPQENAALLVEWGDRTVNPIDPSKFTVAVREGLPRCGAK